MAAERFYGYGKSPNGTNFTLRVYDVDYVGSSTEVTLSAGGIVIDYDTKSTDDRHAPIMGSSCRVTMLVPVGDATINTFVDELRTKKEGQFWLELVSGAGADVRWRGILTSDASNEKDEAGHYTMTITAVCGLGLLKDIPYHDGSAIYSNTAKLTTHIIICLNKLAHIALWGANDALLETSVDWWAETMPTGGANDALFIANIDHAAFYDFHTKGDVDKDVLSCYDVLSNIALSFGARIRMLDGVFQLEQIDYRINHTYSYRQYDKGNAFVTSGSHTGVNTINQTAINGAKLSYVEYDYLPQISKAKVTYECNLRRNFWQGIKLVEGSNFNFNQVIDASSGETKLQMALNPIFGNFKNVGYTGNTNDIVFMELHLKVKVGSYYLKRGGSYSNFAYYPGAASWTTNSADYVVIIIYIGAAGPSGTGSGTGTVNFNLLSPVLLGDGLLNNISLTFSQLTVNNGTSVTSSHFTTTWSSSTLWMSVYDDGTPDSYEDQVLYETVNPNDGTYVWEQSIRLGGGSVNYLGKLVSGANYAYQQWQQGVVSPDTALGALLSEVVTNGQLRPIKRLNGSIYGESIDPRKLLVTSDALEWLPMRITWSPLESTISGSWFEMNYGTAGVPSTPILVKVLTGGASKIPIVAGPVTPFPTGGGGSQGFAQNSPATILAPLAFNTISTQITEAATITSIDVGTALSGNEFLAGDTVTLINPITGQYQDFEVASTPALGATAISVTSEAAEFSAPVGSFLAVKQQAFAFSLPDAASGDILRFNGTDWVVYQGTVDGYVLTWDTTNGWQEEAGGSGSGDILDGGNTTAATVVIGTNDANALHLETENITRIAIDGTTGAGGVVTMTNITAKTSTVQDALIVSSNSSGTAALGFGTGILLKGESSTTDDRDMGGIQGVWTTATDASRASDIYINAVSDAVTGEVARFEGLAQPSLRIANPIGTRGTTEYMNARIRTAAAFTVGASSSVLTLGGSSGTINITTTSASFGCIQIITGSNTSNSGGGVNVNGGQTFTQTSGDRIFWQFASTFAPTSGTATNVLLKFAHTINQTGGANGITRSILIDNTITAAADRREIEIATDSASVKGIYQTGASTINNLVGATGFGSTTAPVATALVEMTSTTKGFLMPRMTTTERDAISSPATGLEIFNTTTAAVEYYNGSAWVSAGGVTGSAATNQGTYWTGTSAIGGNTWWTVDPTNGRHAINGINTGLGSASANLRIVSASGGSSTGFALEGALTGSLSALFNNSSNTASANMICVIASGGTSAGDPVLQFQVLGGSGVTHAIGIDNTDADKFKISPNQNLPGQTADKGVIVTNDAAPKVGINKDAPNYELHVAGRALADDYIGKGNVWNSGHISFGTGAGTGPALNSISGCNNFWQITFTTGTSPTANGDIFTATFPTAWPNISYTTWSPTTEDTATDITKFYAPTNSTTQFKMKANGTLSASTAYSFRIVSGSYGS